MARPYISVKLRRLVSDRAMEYCKYCRFPVKFALESMEIDHAFPVSLGRQTVAENLVLLAMVATSINRVKSRESIQCL